jgi:type VI secretion system protein ImpM
MSEWLAGNAVGDTGLFGKLPSQGDFVARGLRSDFVQPWDAWLQQWIAHSRTALGEQWEKLYQEAPIWRFLIPAGVCGNSAWAGLLQPSVDRVGRYFPLTVAAELPSDLDVLETMSAAYTWYDAIEREAAAAFQSEVRLESLEERLLATRFPLAAVVSKDVAEDTLPLAERVVSALKVAAGSTGDLNGARLALRELQINVGHAHCVWAHTSSPLIERVLLVSRSLPEPQLCCAFLDGRWDVHGWGSGYADAGIPV